MTLKIKLSSLTITAEEFARRVAAHVDALKKYAAHLEGVRLDSMSGDEIKPEDRRVAFPPPSADPLVEQAAAEGYEFEGPTLAEKKAVLFAEVARMEADALQAVIPSAKARHWHFREQDAHVRLAGGIATDADDIFLTDMKARRERQQAIMRHAAKLEHDIDDLTAETVDGFVMAPFNG